MQRTPTSRKSGSNAPHRSLNLTLCLPDDSKTNVSPAKRKKPRGEQLLDRIDKNPNDREAWNERARGSPTNGAKKKKPTPRTPR
jgi:hypothetical protein